MKLPKIFFLSLFLPLSLAACGDRALEGEKSTIDRGVGTVPEETPANDNETPANDETAEAFVSGLWKLDEQDSLVQTFAGPLSDLTLLMAGTPQGASAELFVCQNGTAIEHLTRLDNQYVIDGDSQLSMLDARLTIENGLYTLSVPVAGLDTIDLPLKQVALDHHFQWQDRVDTPLACGHVQTQGQAVMLTLTGVYQDALMLHRIYYDQGLKTQADLSNDRVTLISTALTPSPFIPKEGDIRIENCDAEQVIFELNFKLPDASTAKTTLTYRHDDTLTCPQSQEDEPGVMVPDEPEPAPEPSELPPEEPVSPPPPPVAEKPQSARCNLAVSSEGLTGSWQMNSLTQQLLGLLAGQYPEIVEQANKRLFLVDQGQQVEATICQDSLVRVKLNRNGNSLESDTLSDLIGGLGQSGLTIDGVEVKNDDRIGIKLSAITLDFDKREKDGSSMCVQFSEEPMLPLSDQLCTSHLVNGLKLSTYLEGVLFEVILRFPQSPSAGTYKISDDVRATLISEVFVERYGMNVLNIIEGTITLQTVNDMRARGSFDFQLPDGQRLRSSFISSVQ